MLAVCVVIVVGIEEGDGDLVQYLDSVSQTSTYLTWQELLVKSVTVWYGVLKRGISYSSPKERRIPMQSHCRRFVRCSFCQFVS